MLVVARKIGQRVMVGDDIELTLVDSRKGSARIGIKAPPEVLVLREELIGLDRPTNGQAKNEEADVVDLERVSNIVVRLKLPAGGNGNDLVGTHCKCGSTHLTNLTCVKATFLHDEPSTGATWWDLRYERKV